MVGLDSVGFHVPRFRIPADEFAKAWGSFAAKGIREKSVAAFDEDEATMAVQAAEHALLREPERLGLLAFASSSGAASAKTVAEALGAASARVLDVLGSANAGAAALMSCSEFTEATGAPSLCAIGDAPRGPVDDPTDHAFGAAGVALLVTPKGGLQIRGARAAVRESMGERVATERGVRSLGVSSRAAEAVRAAAKALHDAGYRLEEVEVAVASEPDPGFPAKALGRLVEGKKVKGGEVAALTGDTGACSPFLALFHALDSVQLGTHILLASYGDGAATAIGLKWTDQLRGPGGDIGTRAPHEARGLGRGQPKVEQAGRRLDVLGRLERDRVPIDMVRYLQLRRALSTRSPESEQPRGAYVSMPDYLATLPARYRLEGVRCAKCGHATMGPGDICSRCGSREFHAVKHPHTGKVYAHTVIGRGAAPGEFAEQQRLVGEYPVAVVELDDGARLTAQLTDVEPRELRIGLPLRAVFRRLYVQEGVVRYARKFAPVRAS